MKAWGIAGTTNVPGDEVSGGGLYDVCMVSVGDGIYSAALLLLYLLVIQHGRSFARHALGWVDAFDSEDGFRMSRPSDAVLRGIGQVL